MEDVQYCNLRYSNHQSDLIFGIGELLFNNNLVDCTLAAEGKFLKAHKVVLSACSPYFSSFVLPSVSFCLSIILIDNEFWLLENLLGMKCLGISMTPVLSYGALVWWNTTKLGTRLNMLTSVQRLACLGIYEINTSGGVKSFVGHYVNRTAPEASKHNRRLNSKSKPGQK
uniref:BTB domain-containing protein n=1 Tax=Megaselia scalaris TaxID=36166 RepID=T1GTQ4_MEGSC